MKTILNNVSAVSKAAVIGVLLAAAVMCAGVSAAHAQDARIDANTAKDYSQQGAGESDFDEATAIAAQAFDGSAPKGGGNNVNGNAPVVFNNQSFDGELGEVEATTAAAVSKIQHDIDRAAEIRNKLLTKILAMVAITGVAMFLITIFAVMGRVTPMPVAAVFWAMAITLFAAAVATLSVIMFSGENSIMGLIKELGSLEQGGGIGNWKIWAGIAYGGCTLFLLSALILPAFGWCYTALLPMIFALGGGIGVLANNGVGKNAANRRANRDAKAEEVVEPEPTGGETPPETRSN